MITTHHKRLAIQITIAVVALSSLLIIVWSTWQVVIQPDLGVLWADNGIVYYAHQDTDLFVADQIISIDGIPLNESGFPYYRWQRGDIIQLEINRDGQLVRLETLYTDSAPPFVLTTRLLLNVIALVFLGVSLVVILLSSITMQTILFFLWCQALGMSLALGAVTGQVWAGHLANILTWYAIAMAVHFHLFFPFKQFNSQSNIPFFIVYGIAAVGILVRLLMATEFIALPDGISTWYTVAFYTWALVGLTLVLLLLITAYRKAFSPVVRRQIGMVTLCGFVAGIPLLALSVFPKVLLDAMFLPAQFALLFLIVIPVGYGYAIRKYQLIKVERYMSRSATAVFLIGLLGTFYFGITYLIQNLLHEDILANPLANFLIIMALVIVYNPLYRLLQNLVDYLLYGGWYDYPTVVGQVTHKLEKTTNIEALAETLCTSVQKTMRVYWAYLLWQGQASRQATISVSENTEAPFPLDILQPANLQNIIHYLQKKSQPTNSQTMQRDLDADRLSTEEKQLLDNNLLHLWVPIHGLENSLGLLILGPKYGGDLFNAEDMEILAVVSRQASVIFQNAELISELEERVRENDQYQKEIIRTREEERKRIAREMHDQIIQQLVGLKYHIAQVTISYPLTRPNSSNHSEQIAVDLQDEIGSLIQTTRLLCQNLRPAALDLGLVSSIRSVANRFQMESGLKITLVIEGDRAIPVSEDIALCLFRCTGEALANIHKHASATQATISLSIQPEQVLLTVTDNGLGFTVPERLGSLMKQNHFGLVGMRERVDLLNGTFQITSTPTRGTCLEVAIPLSGSNYDKT